MLQEIAQFIGASGLGAVAAVLAPYAWRAVTGREQKRRDDAQKVWGIVQDLRAENSGLHSEVRRTKEHASLLRRLMLQADCINPDDIPPWPTPGNHKKE